MSATVHDVTPHPADPAGEHAACGYLPGVLRLLICRVGHRLPGADRIVTGEVVR